MTSFLLWIQFERLLSVSHWPPPLWGLYSLQPPGHSTGQSLRSMLCFPEPALQSGSDASPCLWTDLPLSGWTPRSPVQRSQQVMVDCFHNRQRATTAYRCEVCVPNLEKVEWGQFEDVDKPGEGSLGAVGEQNHLQATCHQGTVEDILLQ